MGKKRSRSTYTSKGERQNVSSTHLRAAREAVSEGDRLLNKIAAWKAGKNPWFTVAGPTSSQRQIKVKANVLYGDPRRKTQNVERNDG